MKRNQLTAGAVFAAFLTFAAIGVPLLTHNAAIAQPAMPGLVGKIDFQPTDFTGADSWWYDTDGVDPGVAGCHIGVQSAKDKTPNGRTFGEACQTQKVLIESNPGRNVVHDHVKDIGHPYLVNCDAWCKDAKNAKGGVCTTTVGPAPCESSARCECK